MPVSLEKRAGGCAAASSRSASDSRRLRAARAAWAAQLDWTAFEWLFHQPIVFTWGAGVAAAVVVAFPLAYKTMRVGFEAIDQDLLDSARSQGASEWQVFRYLIMPLAAPSLAAGYILGFARALGEFGATLMVAGNIPGHTQTIPTAIYVAVIQEE